MRRQRCRAIPARLRSASAPARTALSYAPRPPLDSCNLWQRQADLTLTAAPCCWNLLLADQFFSPQFQLFRVAPQRMRFREQADDAAPPRRPTTRLRSGDWTTARASASTVPKIAIASLTVMVGSNVVSP